MERIIDFCFIFLTRLGDFGFIWIAAAVFLIARGDKKTGFAILSALAICVICVEAALKPLFHVERPYITYPGIVLKIAPQAGYSFPSGHACSSFAAASRVFSAYKKAGILAFVLAALISASRVYLNVHYPSDCAAGAALGLLIGAPRVRRGGN